MVIIIQKRIEKKESSNRLIHCTIKNILKNFENFIYYLDYESKEKENMGLDMYAYTIEKRRVKIDNDNNSLIVINENLPQNQFMYWRKHYALHDWMKKLYVSRNGKEEFNCVKIILNKSDLLKLKEDVVNDNLIKIKDDYYGNKEIYEQIKEKDLKFIDIALSCIDDDAIVYYDSWY